MSCRLDVPTVVCSSMVAAFHPQGRRVVIGARTSLRERIRGTLRCRGMHVLGICQRHERSSDQMHLKRA